LRVWILPEPMILFPSRTLLASLLNKTPNPIYHRNAGNTGPYHRQISKGPISMEELCKSDHQSREPDPRSEPTPAKWLIACLWVGSSGWWGPISWVGDQHQTSREGHFNPPVLHFIGISSSTPTKSPPFCPFLGRNSPEICSWKWPPFPRKVVQALAYHKFGEWEGPEILFNRKLK
jgi:hypothetical protein